MDRILKTLIFNNEIALTLLDTTKMVNDAIKIHNLSPLTAAALGRTLTATAFMCSNLKSEQDSLSVSIKGDGVGGTITASGNSKLQIRGAIDNPFAMLKANTKGKLDVAGCVGKGSLTVVKDLGLKMPYVGKVELVSGEIAEDFAEYFLKSEQTPTAIALGVKIGTDLTCLGAGGVVLVPMPECSEESLQKAESVIPKLANISDLIEKNSLEEILKNLFGEYETQAMYPKYECTCNKDYIDKILIAMGEIELYDIIKTEGKVSLHCHFCNKDYVYNKEQIDELTGKKNG